MSSSPAEDSVTAAAVSAADDQSVSQSVSHILVIIAFGIALAGAVLFGVAYYAQRRPQQVDPNSMTVTVPTDGAERKFVVPSGTFVQSMREHVERRRAELAKLVRSTAELRKRWAAMSEAERRTALREQREEVCLAVGGFIDGDAGLLQQACPELNDDGLERLAGSSDALLQLLAQLAEREAKLPAPRGGTPYVALDELVAKELRAAGGPKKEQAARASFLPLFRRSCLIALAIALAEVRVSARARLCV
eukprot:4216127-Prymnesium_polylepis.1